MDVTWNYAAYFYIQPPQNTNNKEYIIKLVKFDNFTHTLNSSQLQFAKINVVPWWHKNLSDKIV